jgi:hypothetical protein
MFSKKFISKEFAIFSPFFYRFHRNFTGWPCDSNRPETGRTGPVEFFNRPDRTGLQFSNRFQL